MRGLGELLVYLTALSPTFSAVIVAPPWIVAQCPGGFQTLGLVEISFQLQTMSSTVNGWPSDHFSPSRSQQVTSV